MLPHQPDEVPYFQFESMDHPALMHAVFSRRGGVSAPPWESLNVGGSVGDVLANVVENQRRVFQTVNRTPESIFDVWQVHSVRVIEAKAPRSPNTPYEQADIILTDQPGITLIMRFADCVPILLFDPVHQAVGIIHSGWKGTINLASRKAIIAMRDLYGSHPADILAAIGPAIGPDHYDVGSEVVSQVRNAFGTTASDFLPQHDGRTYFDLWEANRQTLVEAGVTQIELSGICTACQVKSWYSHRAEHGKTGRFAVLIGLTG